MDGLLARFGVPLLVAGTVWGGPAQDARACSPDPCWESNRWVAFELAHQEIASDGVVVFRESRRAAAITDEEALQYVDVTVTDAAGQPVAGTLEVLESPWHGIVWRPSAPWVAGNYDVSLAVDNDSLGAAHDEEWINEKDWCADNIAADLELVVAPEVLDGFSLAQATSEQSLSIQPLNTLDSLVCCDGAYPQLEYDCGPNESVYWAEGFCTPTLGTGQVSGTLTIDPDGLQASDIVTRLVVDDEQHSYGDPGVLSMSRTNAEPFCARLDAMSLSRGEVWVGEEVCFGADAADQLGTLEIDPAGALERACAGEPYVCETDGEQWDEAACVPWSPVDPGDGGEEEGGGSESDGDAGADDGSGDGFGDDASSVGLDGEGDGSGGEDAGQDDDGVAGRGCACAASSGSSGAGWLLFGLGVIPLLRRRRKW
ncbi:MAG: MYXO-CTERM sorting domain-containing protein [Myxococcota bacterium]